MLLQSLLCTFLSACVTYDTIHSADELTRVSLGWPVRYFFQNQQRFDPPYPWDMTMAWEVSTKIVLVEFIVCWSIFLAIFYGVSKLFRSG